MRKLFFVWILLGLSAAAWSELTPPQEMPLPWGEVGMGLYYARFYPIGFSKKGHFAYCMYKTEADGIGEISLFRFYLVDLVNDTIVDKIEYYRDPSDILPDEDHSSRSFAEVWQEHAVRIEALLEAWKIRPGSQVLHPLPYTLQDGTALDVKVQVRQADEDSYYQVASYRVEAWKGKAKKQVYAKDPAGSLGVSPAGVIVSPWENRAALVLIEYFFGFEASRDAFPLIVGCHLEKGFK